MLLCAALDQAEAQGSGLAVLTFLGGGGWHPRHPQLLACTLNGLSAGSTTPLDAPLSLAPGRSCLNAHLSPNLHPARVLNIVHGSGLLPWR